ncbi:hypothetical protein CQ020_03600 [Arthrobacter sp. MYb23]|nr:hypothetical protein CQ038_03455 [Arthrobacter sp. MYb51]PRB98557.1 hypothetical protein CQ020_03600 [Arthrobacter sp. MYb23]
MKGQIEDMKTNQAPVSVDNPTAVVVDTNAFHQGKLTQGAIRSLETLTDLGLHVIVPDIVCRELASHAWQDYQQAKELLHLSDIGVEGIETAEKIYNNFVSKIRGTGASVGESPHDFYRNSIHAQILRTPPASAKGDVTTGAVDFMVYCHAFEATGRFATVAVVTSDKVLRNSLAGKPGIQVFADFATVRKGGVSHMRLGIQEVLEPLSYLLSKDFQENISKEVLSSEPTPLSVVGVGDILRLNETDLIAYVDLEVPTYLSSTGEFLGRNVERWQVTLAGASYAIGNTSRISTDAVSLWSPDIIHIDDYLSTELSMIPSVLRPVPHSDFVNDQKTPVTYSDNTGSNVEFFLGENCLASVQHSQFTVAHEYEHDGDKYIENRLYTDISVTDDGLKATRLSKGMLARLVTTKALELLRQCYED